MMTHGFYLRIEQAESTQNGYRSFPVIIEPSRVVGSACLPGEDSDGSGGAAADDAAKQMQSRTDLQTSAFDAGVYNTDGLRKGP